MPPVAPEIAQWIRQLASSDEPVAFFAYQSLQEHVLRSSDPEPLITTLGEALTATARSQQTSGAPASFGNNAFLNAVATQRPSYLHPAHVRVHLARLLGYLPHPAAVPHLVRALDDLEARDMARCSLESNPSEAAVDALISGLKTSGATFSIGVLNSLAKRKAARAAPAIRDAAGDPQPEIRIAALNALAAVADLAHDDTLQKATRSPLPEERRSAHVARIRLAGALQQAGNTQSARRLYDAILASDAPEPQKNAARQALARA